MPSSALVRQALAERAEVDPGTLRAALAVVVATAELTRAQTGLVAGPTGTAELVERTGLSPVEVAGGRDLLRGAAVLVGTDSALRIDPDFCCTLPILATVDWAGCRVALEGVGGRVAPALAVVRETARVSQFAVDGGGEWLAVPIQELVEETLYGRTAVTQAVGDLARAGLLLRAEQPSRKGLKIRLHPQALGAGSPVRIGEGNPGNVASVRTQNHTGAGVRLEVGGASLLVPAGSHLRLPEGLDYRLEIGPDGGAIVRIDD